MESVHRMQGRDLRESDIAAIRSLIATNPTWHRTRLSIELTQIWNWRSAAGQFQDMAARSLLLKLDRRGWITLPARRGAHHPRRASTPQAMLPMAAPIAEPLAGLLPLRVEEVPPRHPERMLFSSYLSQHHYLGYRGPVGESLAYLVRDCQGRDLACVLFGSAAWKTKPRDAWIGWDDDTRCRRLSFVANNHRFLILPWVLVPHLASHILGRIARRLADDWQTKYGHPIYFYSRAFFTYAKIKKLIQSSREHERRVLGNDDSRRESRRYDCRGGSAMFTDSAPIAGQAATI